MACIRSSVVIAAFLGLSLGGFGRAHAGLITYTIQTTTGGTLGGTTYTNAAVTLALTGDTANIVHTEPGVYYLSGTATITIDGLGTATFTNPFSVYAYQPGSAVGFYAGSTFTSSNYTLPILNLTAPGYASYDLSTPFGPVAGGTFTSYASFGFETNRGTLLFSPAPGVFSAASSAVPEPASVVMLGMGLLGLISTGRRVLPS